MAKRRYRSRRRDEDEEDEMTVSEKLEEAKELQTIRKRPSGVSAAGLAYGKKYTLEEEKMAPDPFKLKTGGLINLKEITNEEIEGTEDEVVKRLASQFSAESQTRDDETHMMKYIETEMAKIKGQNDEEKKLTDYEVKIASLYQVPERLKIKEKKQSEEMLSNQMLSGIPEVDLGLEAKFKNIEETELAKRKIIEDQTKKKEKKTSLAPTNMASNFTLHSLRFFKEKAKPLPVKREEDKSNPAPVYIPVVGSNEEPELKPSITIEVQKRKNDTSQMASDDYHYDKFKKKVKRF